MNTKLIYGPPGTGKTTRLINIVQDCLEDGYGSEKICYIAFTRKAAEEARHRIHLATGANPKEFPWFRTIHSLAYHQLGLSRHEVMNWYDYRKIAQTLGLQLTYGGIQEDGTVTGLSTGDRLFFMVNQAAVLGKDLRTYWEENNEDIYWYQLEQVAGTIARYKTDLGKTDFTEMVVRFTEQNLIPDVNILFVDEAQDLSPLQWKLVNKIKERVDEAYIAGDDDQAIFKWAGADVDSFIHAEGSKEVLAQSWRVPFEIASVADTLVNQIGDRVQKEWKPREGSQGSIEYVSDVNQIDMSEGSWMLLARNVYLLEQFENYCMDQGYVFTSNAKKAVNEKLLTAIQDWEMLRSGGTITMGQFKAIAEYITVKQGIKYGFKTKIKDANDEHSVNIDDLESEFGLCTSAIWHEALDRFPQREREYFLAARRRGEKLLAKPRIHISTIHGVKGGEADNVVVCTDMAFRTYQEYEQDPDSEHRVWYVAITRAKEKLWIIQPRTNRNYDI
jgi:DNA helicase-2/ATP-dependent DNA helicase PcrA